MTILVTRPRHDKATNCLYCWSQPVIDLARKKGIPLIDLTGKKASKSTVWNYCRKVKPSFLFLNGHGSPATITGHDYQEIISITDNLSRFAGYIFYSRSCDSAAILGHELIRKGAKGFIGYKRKFTVAFMPEFLTQPLSDPLAKLFMEPSNLIPISVIKGNALSDAYHKSQSAMRANLRKMLSSNATFENRYYSSYLWSNIKHQTLLGDPTAKA